MRRFLDWWYYTEKDWKKIAIFGGIGLILVLLIVFSILVSTGVIKFSEEPITEDNDKLFTQDKNENDEKLRNFYFQSFLSGKEIKPRLYYEGIVSDRYSDGMMTRISVTVHTSGEDRELTYTIPTGEAEVFDANKSQAISLGALTKGDSVTVYVDEESSEIPYAIIRGTGYKALEIETVQVKKNGAMFIISSDNAVMLTTLPDVHVTYAVYNQGVLNKEELSKGDILIFKDDNTSSMNKYYLTDTGELTKEKPLTSSGVVRETGGTQEIDDIIKYAYVDYTSINLLIFKDYTH